MPWSGRHQAKVYWVYPVYPVCPVDGPQGQGFEKKGTGYFFIQPAYP
jgi:hypothetical protein